MRLHFSQRCFLCDPSIIIKLFRGTIWNVSELWLSLWDYALWAVLGIRLVYCSMLWWCHLWLTPFLTAPSSLSSQNAKSLIGIFWLDNRDIASRYSSYSNICLVLPMLRYPTVSDLPLLRILALSGRVAVTTVKRMHHFSRSLPFRMSTLLIQRSAFHLSRNNVIQ